MIITDAHSEWHNIAIGDNGLYYVLVFILQGIVYAFANVDK